MKKPHKLKSEPGNTYRFRSPLLADAAIARLNSELKGKFSLWHGHYRYRVSHEKLRDSHYFEVQQLGAKWLPERVVTGVVRQLDEQSTLIECEVKKAERLLPGFEFAAAGVLIAAVITTMDGSAIRELVILLWALLAVATAFVLWLRRRQRHRTDPLVERIQRILQG